ncbi:MAG: hypothetical protein KGI67_15495 [Pseudomonadota bacterium]|nr:hypothetical protein [Pseudomonadota bacterium]
MEVLLLTEESRAATGRWWLFSAVVLMALGAGLLLLAAQRGLPAAHESSAARAEGPSGLLVPSPNDAAWTDYYRSRRDGVRMSVHLPATRRGDSAIVWERFSEAARATVALAEMHYDCGRRTRRSARMAVYRNGALDGIADLPGAADPVAVVADSVEQDALLLVCEGRLPAVVDEAD